MNLVIELLLSAVVKPHGLDLPRTTSEDLLNTPSHAFGSKKRSASHRQGGLQPSRFAYAYPLEALTQLHPAQLPLRARVVVLGPLRKSNTRPVNGPESRPSPNVETPKPSLIIEYACQDLGGNPLDHLHTMYRDPTNEYGRQLDTP